MNLLMVYSSPCAAYFLSGLYREKGDWHGKILEGTEEHSSPSFHPLPFCFFASFVFFPFLVQTFW